MEAAGHGEGCLAADVEQPRLNERVQRLREGD